MRSPWQLVRNAESAATYLDNCVRMSVLIRNFSLCKGVEAWKIIVGSDSDVVCLAYNLLLSISHKALR